MMIKLAGESYKVTDMKDEFPVHPCSNRPFIEEYYELENIDTGEERHLLVWGDDRFQLLQSIEESFLENEILQGDVSDIEFIKESNDYIRLYA